MDEAATTMSQERSEMRPRNTLPPQSVFSIKFLKILKNISKIFFFLFFFFVPTVYIYDEKYIKNLYTNDRESYWWSLL